MISERSNRSPNIRAFSGEDCLADDEAIFLLLLKTITRFMGMKVLIPSMTSPAVERQVSTK